MAYLIQTRHIFIEHTLNILTWNRALPIYIDVSNRRYPSIPLGVPRKQLIYLETQTLELYNTRSELINHSFNTVVSRLYETKTKSIQKVEQPKQRIAMPSPSYLQGSAVTYSVSESVEKMSCPWSCVFIWCVWCIWCAGPW